MQETKVKVIFVEKARKSIRNIAFYIIEKGYPVRAENFAIKLFDFGYSLTTFPEKYPICKQKHLAKQKLHCAVFNKTYVFIYRLIGNTIVIYNVIHVKTNPAYYSA